MCLGRGKTVQRITNTLYPFRMRWSVNISFKRLSQPCRHLLITAACTLYCLSGNCQEPIDTVNISLSPEMETNLATDVLQAMRHITKGLNDVDTLWIEPQRYNFTAMLQTTGTYEMYRLRSKSGQTLVFAPRTRIKVGPYFGWRWIFLGYTFDIGHLNSDMKKEWVLSFYSSKVGVDLFYRKTGNDYLLRSAHLGNDINTHSLRNASFSGLKVNLKGFNAYWIFNHRHFSYPAAFSQSTVQRRSAGSLLAGIGYTRHVLNLNYDKLHKMIDSHIPDISVELDSGLAFNKVKYTDVSASVGYGYNYVPCRNVLLAASLSAALGYHYSRGEIQNDGFSLRDFSFRNFNLDGVGRFAAVYNNSRFFAGASAIFHAYNYHKSQFETNNIFGSINIYIGMNFGKRKRTPKKSVSRSPSH